MRRPDLRSIARLLVVGVALALATVTLATAAAAQTCRSCANQGVRDCKKHKGSDRELEASDIVRFCSFVADCKTCRGALTIDCRRCENVTAEGRLAERLRLGQEWRAGRTKNVDDVAESKQDVLHLRTPHCELAFSIEPLTVGRKKLSTHALMHLYGQRIEDLRELFRTTLELEDRDLPGTLQVFMFADRKTHQRVCPQVTGIGGSGNRVKLMGVPCVLCLFQDKRDAPDDDALHGQIVHNVTHLLLSNMTDSIWLGNRKHGWVDAGVAHWFEDKVVGRCANFCYDELLLTPGTTFKGGRWRTPVRKLVDARKAVTFAELSQRNTDQLSFEEHAVAFAYIDFLLTAHGGGKLRDFVRLLKKKAVTRDALKTVYGLTPLSIDGEFADWVRANYSPIEKR